MVVPTVSAAEGQPEGGPDIGLLRLEIEQLRSEYEGRIAELERRLDAAEKAAEQARESASLAHEEARRAGAAGPPPATAPGASSGISVAADNAFNPAIGVIFQGQAWSYQNDPDDYAIPGFPLGGEAGLPSEGFSLAETEINISANVDDKFTAWLTVPVVIEDGEAAVEVEEAWIETLRLPAGLSLRMGRSYSNIGYLNNRHSHAWDFTDQPLVYQAFLGNQYLDDGLRLRWLAPTDFFLELSGEILRGDRYPAGGAARSGVGSHTLSVKTGGDIGFSSSWLAGVSWLSAESEDRESGSEDDPLFFAGDTDLWIADFVWKWAENGDWKQRNFKFQAEYFRRREDGVYLLPAADESLWSSRESGWYAQAVYQPFPQWRFGARIDRLYPDRVGPEWLSTPLYTAGDDPVRYSLMVDWSNSEFSRIRLQYNRDESGEVSDNQLGLQYLHSIGAHGAHSF